MKNDAIRRKIAEACRWTDIVCYGVPAFLLGKQRDGSLKELPNYPESHDAMAEAINGLGGYDREFARRLAVIVGIEVSAGSVFYSDDIFKLIDATPLQKAEAFLKAKGLWEEA